MESTSNKQQATSNNQQATTNKQQATNNNYKSTTTATTNNNPHNNNNNNNNTTKHNNNILFQIASDNVSLTRKLHELEKQLEERDQRVNAMHRACQVKTRSDVKQIRQFHGAL